MKKLTYLDSSVLIQAYRGEGVSGERAMRVLDDPHREFVVSDFLKLEVLPKPSFHGREDEVAFMTAIIQNAKDISTSERITSCAIDIASNNDLSAIDALHISSAIIAEADEFVTMEKPTRPMFKVDVLKITSLFDSSDESE